MFAHDMKNAVYHVGGGSYRGLISGKAEPWQKSSKTILKSSVMSVNNCHNSYLDFMELARFEAKNISLFCSMRYTSRDPESIEPSMEAQKKKITISIELQETMLPMINADADKISRVIRNLLDNAIKILTKEVYYS